METGVRACQSSKESGVLYDHGQRSISGRGNKAEEGSCRHFDDWQDSRLRLQALRRNATSRGRCVRALEGTQAPWGYNQSRAGANFY